jgi:endonuclease/exonuclease/phosphatase family metal-dependent hydrolase
VSRDCCTISDHAELDRAAAVSQGTLYTSCRERVGAASYPVMQRVRRPLRNPVAVGQEKRSRDGVFSGMRVATWNVARPVPSARRRRKLVAGQIQAVEADVWVLTETHDDVEPGPEYRSASTSGADRASGPGERWVSIWSRFPIEPLPSTSDPVRAVAARIAPARGTPLIVYGTVLPWLGSSWRGIEAVDGKAFEAALDVQAADWRAIRRIHPDHDLMVAGDFNQDLADTHYYGSRANRLRLTAALQQADLIALTASGDDPVRRGSPTNACIDHVCVSEALRRRCRSVHRWPDTPRPDRRMSDHFGIAVEFSPAG